MTFPTYEKWGEKIAEQVIDVYLINDRTIREWIEILSDELTMLDKIRAEIKHYNLRPSNYPCDMISIGTVLQIIDHYRNEVSE